jgi:hypothetical protein
MKRLIASLLAVGALAAAEPLLAQSFPMFGTPSDISCMQTAIKQRDTAMIASFTAFNASVTAALGARRDASVAAWQQGDMLARETALRTAEQTFNQAYAKATMMLEQSKSGAAMAYQQQSMQCRLNGVSTSSFPCIGAPWSSGKGKPFCAPASSSSSKTSSSLAGSSSSRSSASSNKSSSSLSSMSSSRSSSSSVNVSAGFPPSCPADQHPADIACRAAFPPHCTYRCVVNTQR